MSLRPALALILLAQVPQTHSDETEAGPEFGRAGLFAHYMILSESKAREEGLEQGLVSIGFDATRVLTMGKSFNIAFSMRPSLVSGSDRYDNSIQGWLLNIESSLTYHINNTIGISYGIGTNLINISRPQNQCSTCENDNTSSKFDLSGASYLTTGVLFSSKEDFPMFAINYRRVRSNDYGNYLSLHLLYSF